jgi:hypothetical protein
VISIQTETKAYQMWRVIYVVVVAYPVPLFQNVVAFPTDGIGCKGIFPFKLRKLGKGAGFDFALAFVVGYDDSLW